MDSNKLKLLIILVVAVIAAVYLGIAAATAQFEVIAWVVGSATMIVCILLGPRIWLLIPFLGSMKLTLMIPGQPTTMIVAQALFVGFATLMFLSRKLPFRFKFTELEFWIFLLTLMVVQVYLRNPVGLNIFGGSQVGGRPYVLFGLAFIASLFLCGLIVPPKDLKTALKLSILGSLANFCIGLLGRFWLPVNYLFGQGSASAPEGPQREVIDTTMAGRVDFVRSMAQTLATTVSAFKNPLLAAFSFKWAPLIFLSLVFAAVSGYRNVVAAIALTYFVGLIYRGGFLSIVGSAILGAMALGVVAAVNSVTPLPPNIQRAFSFLPGTWDSQYETDSEGSTNWRVEIWEEVLLTDRWIHNKILGDGLGFSASELAMQQNLAYKMKTMGNAGAIGSSGFDLHREAILSNGDYHSGPVSAIRTIGYIGLIVMTIAQLRMVVHAHRQIKRAKGTEWFPVVLFFCIPIVWFPVFFWLIFGGFSLDAPALLMSAAMLRMLQNNLPLPPYVGRSKMPYVLIQRNQAAIAE